jgi:cell pole-organizing protein PopZ
MASSPQHEPTMEEILASIRKIISEDSNEAPASASASDDVLELTQELPAEAPPPPRPEPVRAAAPARPESDVVFQAAEPARAPAASSEDIFSEKTRKAMDDTFAKIPAAVSAPTPAAAAAAPARMAAAPDGSSVEAVFERAVANAFDRVLHQWMNDSKADLLASVKPLIREWMDEHFPALLEGAVRNEVERVVRSRGGK